MSNAVFLQVTGDVAAGLCQAQRSGQVEGEITKLEGLPPTSPRYR